MKEQSYHCEVYQYDEYDRNRIHEAIVDNLSAYAARLDIDMPEWDEIEFRTEPDPVRRIFDEVDDSKFQGKLVNPKSKYIFIHQR